LILIFLFFKAFYDSEIIQLLSVYVMAWFLGI